MKLSNNKSYILFFIGAYVIFFLAISRNLFTPYLWYDEAGQFWIAKGLNHDSEPMTPEKGVLEVIENNKYYNLDPGGFGILLHYWTFISNHHVWLRMLPFFFFIGVVISFIYLSFVWTRNINVAILMGFIPILSPKLLYMAFEIRAYSMECLGTVIGIIALENLNTRITYRKLLLWSCVFSFFMTSRYSEILILYIVSIYVLYLITKSELTLAQKVLSILLYSLPLLVTLAYVYFFALVFQNNDLLELYYLPYLSKDISILVEPQNILALLCIALLIRLFYQKHKYPLIEKYQSLVFVTVLSNILFIILSFLGKHPWSLSNFRCISLIMLFTICFVSFCGEVILKVFEKSTDIAYNLSYVMVFFSFYSTSDNLFIRNRLTYNVFYNKYIYDNFTVLNTSKYDKIFVEYGEGPFIKYLYEYGKLSAQKKKVYPNKFTFQKGTVHSIGREVKKFTDVTINKLLEFDLIIMPSEAIRSRCPECRYKLVHGTKNFFERY
ncbi:hypothetical protein [Runella salmonicolor]|uniref:Dolichyl-phosphate-mannose-protein mannosyltransferase n=1 Tax=Runella salmonicolor TaxID=2950278 RepID=A0ABT1FL12_9BACT|nr:hypothetical protein [Runella salmonicolor]MCP1381212.1 hypothetical protein [Runella salmonicolor]